MLYGFFTVYVDSDSTDVIQNIGYLTYEFRKCVLFMPLNKLIICNNLVYSCHLTKTDLLKHKNGDLIDNYCGSRRYLIINQVPSLKEICIAICRGTQTGIKYLDAEILKPSIMQFPGYHGHSLPPVERLVAD